MAKEGADMKVKTSKGKWSLYDTKSGLKRERKSCPKCGGGVFMAKHQDRLSCGKCGYTEFTVEKIIHVFPQHRKTEKPKAEAATPQKEAEAVKEAGKEKKK